MRILAIIPKHLIQKPLEDDSCEVHTFYEPYSFASMVKALSSNARKTKLVIYGKTIIYYIEREKDIIYVVDFINSTYPAIIFKLRISRRLNP